MGGFKLFLLAVGIDGEETLLTFDTYGHIDLLFVGYC
jgi:hypothetical protein